MNQRLEASHDNSVPAVRGCNEIASFHKQSTPLVMHAGVCKNTLIQASKPLEIIVNPMMNLSLAQNVSDDATCALF